jgi:spore maturation protein SpmA
VNGASVTGVNFTALFAGTPRAANCVGESVSALAREYGGLNNAAAALGYSSVAALQDAISTFCGR